MITVGIATVPERADQFKRVLADLKAQDAVVFGYASHGQKGDFTDAGKFNALQYASEGHVLFCDDDLYYPKDYVAKLIEGIDRNPGCVCSFGGGILRDPPITSYYHGGRKWKAHCIAHNIPEDMAVNIVGTGVCGWKVGTIQISPEMCPEPYMADIHLALAAQRQRVPMRLLKHPDNWITHQEIDYAETIWGKFHESDAPMAKKINDYNQPFEVF